MRIYYITNADDQLITGKIHTSKFSAEAEMRGLFTGRRGRRPQVVVKTKIIDCTFDQVSICSVRDGKCKGCIYNEKEDSKSGEEIQTCEEKYGFKPMDIYSAKLRGEEDGKEN